MESSLTLQSYTQKYEILRKLKRCFNCMGAHTRTQCQSQRTYRSCNGSRHHISLHQPNMPNTENISNKPTASPLNVTQLPSCESPDTPPNVLIATVEVLMQENTYYFQEIRAVIDPGSQISLIIWLLVQQLGLKHNRYF